MSEMRNSISSNQMADICLEDSYNASKEDIQIALAPDIQAYLTESSKRHSCCSVSLPVAFERAEPKSWFDPKFDSPVLEEQFRTSVYPQIRLRFRFALVYILFCSLTWFIYFMADNKLTEVLRGTICVSLTLIFISSSIGLWLTYTKYYRLYSYVISSTIAIAISITSLCFLGFAFNSFSLLGHFALCIEIVFIIYTVIPLPLWQCSTITIVHSIMFEILTYFLQQSSPNDNFNIKLIVIRILLQLCIHTIGAHVLIMNVVRMRGTFMKVGQNLLVRRQLEMEKQLKEKMIHSVMPPKVADMLLKETNTNPTSKYDKPKKSNDSKSNDVKSLFRPFHMHSMNNVSILFADIVGFTKMSSTKTAEELVEILNDLFERFDDMCEMSGCEKISTLGDCYYCVSGCPEPRPDHAICCVEMGLGMIKTMQDFDAQRHEGVKIRVGVHTGTVLCGIVGTRRVKFDVWSNDVSLANKMESTGRPEQVHISQETSNFLSDTYILEEGEEVFGHRTYFVAGKKKESPKNSSLCVNETSSEKLSQSTLALPELSVPPTSPVGHMQTAHSAGPSPIMSLRPRLASLGKVSKFLSSKKNESKNIMLQPQIIITAKSLPGSLNEDNNDEGTIITIPIPTCKQIDHMNHKNTSFFRNFNKFLRKPTMAYENNTPGHDKSPGESAAEQNGYCQLPVVIETNNKSNSNHNSGNLLTVPTSIIITTSAPKENHHYHHDGGGLLSPSGGGGGGGQFSMFDDIIDVRSYISQSRSDISPFGRTGSYRSHCGRSPNYDDTAATTTRPRSSTITSQLLQIDHNNDNGNQRSLIERCSGADTLSVCASVVGSRKDSGIRSNSRRSSIQQQIFQLNQTTHNRVSGYFTSSQSSLTNIPHHVNLELIQNQQPYPDPLAACLQQFRKQSDLQLIKCVRDNAKSQRNYLVKPPISKITLFFKSRIMEKEFRSKAHRLGGRHNGSDFDATGLPTLATPKYNTFLDIFVGILFYFSITVSLFLLIQSTYEFSYRIWVGLFILFTVFNCFVLIICSRQVCKTAKPRTNSISNHNFNVSSNYSSNRNNDNYNMLIDSISGWYIWNFFGAIFLMLPTVSVLVNYMLQNYEKCKHHEYYFGFLVFICIIHFCNFTQLNCWMRNLLSLISATLFLVITIVTRTTEVVQSATTTTHFSDNSTILRDNTNSDSNLLWYDNYRIEICLDLLLILLLIWFLNREFEIGYRLSFYGSAVANQDKSRVENMKNQADMLLQNIIPKYVADQLKSTAKYSENHQNVGIIFASIVNFNELYDESYLGGKEYLRVLNELIGDFDELLSRDEFLCIEKIKTIGSTFMAASGLDKLYRGDNYEHIHALLEFGIAMQAVVEAFNKDLIEFNLILRIGINIGDVAAGVIGTSKLYYDIWGDSVNVASRMDSTGLPGRIQIGKDCLHFLEERYNFEPRGKVYVKGKDDMEVYLYKDRKPDLPGDDDLMNGF